MDTTDCNRRDFIKSAAAGAAVSAAVLASPSLGLAAKTGARLKLPALPYAKDALEPVISRTTLEYHYGKHHRGYVDKTNKFIQGTEYENMLLNNIVKKSALKPGDETVFNNSAQAWNHGFYWKCMKPGGGGEPKDQLLERINKDFGSLENFNRAFFKAASGQFGSGWAWLAQKGGALKVLKTANADTPFARGFRPLLTIDVWEHAYYLDYHNKRSEYIKAFMDKLINWDFVQSIFLGR